MNDKEKFIYNSKIFVSIVEMTKCIDWLIKNEEDYYAQTDLIKQRDLLISLDHDWGQIKKKMEKENELHN